MVHMLTAFGADFGLMCCLVFAVVPCRKCVFDGLHLLFSYFWLY